MVAELRKLTDKPVRYVVNTHWHDDHHSGNFIYRQPWPGVEFIGHPDTRSDILAKSYGSRAKDLAEIEKSAQTIERWIAQGKDDSGKAMDEKRIKRGRTIVEAQRSAIAELKTIEEASPDLTFERRWCCSGGSARSSCSGSGAATPAATWWCCCRRSASSQRAICSCTRSRSRSTATTRNGSRRLGKLDALPADVLFLSHGYPQRDRAYLRQVQGLLRALVEQTKAAAAKGLSVEQAKETITLADWKATFAGGNEDRERAFDGFFVQPAVERAFRQAKGEAAALGPPE